MQARGDPERIWTTREYHGAILRTPNSEPFFIVGSGRSGSTLLRVMLASHSRISIPPETWYLIPLLEELPADRPLTAAEVDLATGIITNHYRWPDMGMSADEFRARVAKLQNPWLRNVTEVVYQDHLAREGKARWGDKTPGYIKIAPQLAVLYPGARFIHLYRDGRDVAKSFQTVGWYGPQLHDNTREWNEAIDWNERLSRTDLASRFLQLRYEDLVLAPEKALREVCNFLGEEYEPQTLAWQRHLDQMIPAREAAIHQKLNRPPAVSDAYRWKREFKPHQVLVAEAFMGDRLTRLGYERRYKGPAAQVLLPAVRIYCRVVLPVWNFVMRAFRFARKRLAPGAPAEAARPGR